MARRLPSSSRIGAAPGSTARWESMADGKLADHEVRGSLDLTNIIEGRETRHRARRAARCTAASLRCRAARNSNSAAATMREAAQARDRRLQAPFPSDAAFWAKPGQEFAQTLDCGPMSSGSDFPQDDGVAQPCRTRRLESRPRIADGDGGDWDRCGGDQDQKAPPDTAEEGCQVRAVVSAAVTPPLLTSDDLCSIS